MKYYFLLLLSVTLSYGYNPYGSIVANTTTTLKGIANDYQGNIYLGLTSSILHLDANTDQVAPFANLTLCDVSNFYVEV
jgi:hypothetical protein